MKVIHYIYEYPDYIFPQFENSESAHLETPCVPRWQGMSDDELPPLAFCGEDCPFMVKGCEDFCPVKAYGSEVAAKAREEGAKAEWERIFNFINSEVEPSGEHKGYILAAFLKATYLESLRSTEAHP